MKLENKTILVTGGTGSFGKHFIKTLYKEYNPKKIIVFSRDELKQFEMQNDLDDVNVMRYFLGDIRDKERLLRAFEGVDLVIHAAALKQVPAAEYNPMEFIKTNVLGSQNIIEAALDKNVSKVVALSTDKAAAPINLYGATKLCSDKLFVAANNLKGWKETSFSVVRYGNVMGSRGSVIPYFNKIKHTGIIPITDSAMTRFNITLDEGVNFVLNAIDKSIGGEIFIPKIPSYKISDIAKAVAPECKIKIIGIRPGEKIHEEMITKSDAPNTLDCGDYFIVYPFNKRDEFLNHKNFKNAKSVPIDFNYSSGSNDIWLNVSEIKKLLKNLKL